MLGAHPALAQVDEASTRPGPLASDPAAVPTVLVEAPEPRYVAPTLRDRIGRIWAPVLINGQGPFRLVLNTGANSSAILPSVVEKLGISLEDTRQVKINGATGSAVVPVIDVEQLEVGELLIERVRLPIVQDVFGGAEGVLGPTGFADKRIFIDFRNDLIRIARSNRERAAGGVTRVPIKPNRWLLPMFDIKIGKVRTTAVLDTGAQQTMGNQSLREALLRKSKRGLKKQEIVGVTLDVAYGQSIDIPPISLGDIEINNLQVHFGNDFIFGHWGLTEKPAILIGMDLIGTLETLVIDYKMAELHLRARQRRSGVVDMDFGGGSLLPSQDRARD
jgi:predicted aspartyl protease